jgi:hypothetical protein
LKGVLLVEEETAVLRVRAYGDEMVWQWPAMVKLGAGSRAKAEAESESVREGEAKCWMSSPLDACMRR